MSKVPPHIAITYQPKTYQSLDKPTTTRKSSPLNPTEIAAAMTAAYDERHERTDTYGDPLPECLAAALRAMPPGCDVAAVADALEALE
jgi:hypothetical protein